jgi:hypothetical protein
MQAYKQHDGPIMRTTTHHDAPLLAKETKHRRGSYWCIDDPAYACALLAGCLLLSGSTLRLLAGVACGLLFAICLCCGGRPALAVAIYLALISGGWLLLLAAAAARRSIVLYTYHM